MPLLVLGIPAASSTFLAAEFARAFAPLGSTVASSAAIVPTTRVRTSPTRTPPVAGPTVPGPAVESPSARAVARSRRQHEPIPARFALADHDAVLPVVIRTGFPHFRHGRPRGISESKERWGRSRPRGPASGRRPSDCGTKTVVVSHCSQWTSSVPPRPPRTERGDPHSAHSNPSTPAAASSSEPAPSSPSGTDGGRPSLDATVLPSRNANSLVHDGQTPVRRWTSRASNSIAVPQSGQLVDMIVQLRDPAAPH